MKKKKNLLPSNLKYLLALKGMTQTQLSKELGYANSTISNYINSKSEPEPDRLVDISMYFGVPVDDLLKSDLTKKHPSDQSQKTDDSDLIIKLLTKEVRRLREQIEEHGSTIDKERADQAIEDAINGMKEDKENGK